MQEIKVIYMKEITIIEIKNNPDNFKICNVCGSIKHIDSLSCCFKADFKIDPIDIINKIEGEIMFWCNDDFMPIETAYNIPIMVG